MVRNVLHWFQWKSEMVEQRFLLVKICNLIEPASVNVIKTELIKYVNNMMRYQRLVKIVEIFDTLDSWFLEEEKWWLECGWIESLFIWQKLL